MAKKKSKEKKPKVHDELSGFDLTINEFGEIKTNINVDKINDFLNKNVDDKKLRKQLPKEEDLLPVDEVEEKEDDELNLEDIDIDEIKKSE